MVKNNSSFDIDDNQSILGSFYYRKDINWIIIFYLFINFLFIYLYI